MTPGEQAQVAFYVVLIVALIAWLAYQVSLLELAL